MRDMHVTWTCVHGTVGSLRRVRFTYPLRPLAYNPVQLADRGQLVS